MKLSEYDQADATELAKWVASGQVSARELVEAAVQRIAERNGDLNAVVSLDVGRARSACEELPKGPFTGVPFLLKDLLAEDAGQPSTHSNRLRKEWRAPYDCELVKRFKRSGLNIVGRTNAPEFGIVAVTESEFRGPCRNPYDLNKTPGGSSGGSGSAVASRMVPMAHAGDGGGSIRIPASHCGLYGLKPSRGRVPMGPDRSEGWGGMVVELGLTRSLRDTAALLEAVCGPEPGGLSGNLPHELPFPQQVGREPGPLRIRYSTDALFGDTVHPEHATAVRDTAKRLSAVGHEVEEGLPPFDRTRLIEAYLGLVAVGVAGEIDALEQVVGRRVVAQDVEMTSWLLSRIGKKMTGPETTAHRESLLHCTRSLARWFEEVDLFVSATVAGPPVSIGNFDHSTFERMQLATLRTLDLRVLYRLALKVLAADALAATPNTMLFNLSGSPALSVPTGMDGTGLPIGVQLVAPWGREDRLLQVASQLDAMQPPMPPPTLSGDVGTLGSVRSVR